MIGVFVPWSDARPNGPGWVIDGNGCHIWVGARRPNGLDARGYGVVWADGRLRQVSRVRYEREIGPIPDGMHLDHYVCDNGRGGCCNPRHCRPVTQRENNLRSDGRAAHNSAKTHCERGHAYTADNLSPARLVVGERVCLRCRRERARRYYCNRRGATPNLNRKLNEQDVLNIRARRGGGETATGLAREYGVALATIVDACKYRTWRHVA